jgi:hypothetical protein
LRLFLISSSGQNRAGRIPRHTRLRTAARTGIRTGGSGYVRSDYRGAAGCDRDCCDRAGGEVSGDTAVGGVCLIDGWRIGSVILRACRSPVFVNHRIFLRVRKETLRDRLNTSHSTFCGLFTEIPQHQISFPGTTFIGLSIYNIG